MVDVVENVFHYDIYDNELRQHLVKVFKDHGIPLGGNLAFDVQYSKPKALPSPIHTSDWNNTGKETSSNLISMGLEIVGTVSCRSDQSTKIVDKIQGRVHSFSEEVLSWRINTSGDVQSIHSTNEGTLISLTVSPLKV